MTEQEAKQFILACDEDDGPSDWAELRGLFAALYGREPDDDDGDFTQVWSLCCAAVDQ